jgi:hypothetical protein
VNAAVESSYADLDYHHISVVEGEGDFGWANDCGFEFELVGGDESGGAGNGIQTALRAAKQDELKAGHAGG